MRVWLVGLGLACGVVVACQFDPSGLASPDLADGGSGDARALDAAADATPACLDGDGDGAFVAGQPAASCPEPSDCDDGDARARPGQEDFFETPRAAGGFDFNCDGEEEPFDAAIGGRCRDEWFECVGTGWVQTAPACGGAAAWHECVAGNWGCMEASTMSRVMACR